MEKYIPLKTTIEVARQRRACIATYAILTKLSPHIRVGVTTRELDSVCKILITQQEARPALKGYRGYPGNSCISVNHVAAHGLPSDYSLHTGDIVTVDLTVEIDGWHGDSAWTYPVGTPSHDSLHLIKAAWNTTMAAIKATVAGKRMGDVGSVIVESADSYGCSVLDSFVGHGIGRSMHEEPMVLNSGDPDTGTPIVPGMVFTIEPILCAGKPEVYVLDDGWTVVTKDSSRCAQFEHTVAVFSNRTEVLTAPRGSNIVNLDFPPVI